MNNLIGALSNYGLFFAKTFTLVIAALVVFGGFVAIAMKNKNKDKERIEITNLNEKYDDIRAALQEDIYSKEELKEFKKQEKEKEKKEKLELKIARKKQEIAAKAKQKQNADHHAHAYIYTGNKTRRRIFVLDFYGDMRALEVENLRSEITAILTIATPMDEVLVKIESAGGIIYNYGLAASQLKRIRDRNIPLTVAVDKVAASGGYMMACVADRILAAPFAIVGSIGVIVQLPNFNRLLKKHNIDFEQISAGEYKRTLSLLGENTNKGRQKLQEEVEEAHTLFKSFVATHRPIVNIENIATGEHWYGMRAKELRLIDEIVTSDDYLMQASNTADLYEISYIVKQNLLEKITSSIDGALGKLTKLF